MEIGKPQREIVVLPLKVTRPAKEPAPAPREPVPASPPAAPERTKEPVPA